MAAADLPSEPPSPGRRRYPRYDTADLPGVLVQALEGTIRDVGLGGIGTVTAAPLPVGKRVAVRLTGRAGGSLLLGAVVRWCRAVVAEGGPTYTAGLSFDDLWSDEARQLAKFLEENLEVEPPTRLFGRVRIEPGGTVLLEADHRFLVKRISLSGMLVESSFPAEAGALVPLELSLDGAAVTGRGRIANVTHIRIEDGRLSYRIGIEWIDLDGPAREALEAFLARRLADSGPSQ